MRILIGRSARRHGITRDEIHATIEYPRLSYRVESRVDPDAEIYMFIGAREREAWIEVAAESTATAWLVFHAMLLRRRTAADIEDLSDGAVVLDPVRTQRPPERGEP